AQYVAALVEQALAQVRADEASTSRDQHSLARRHESLEFQGAARRARPCRTARPMWVRARMQREQEAEVDPQGPVPAMVAARPRPGVDGCPLASVTAWRPARPGFGQAVPR